jgi:hypothetical protein
MQDSWVPLAPCLPLSPRNPCHPCARLSRFSRDDGGACVRRCTAVKAAVLNCLALLLYYYKSTNTDATQRRCLRPPLHRSKSSSKRAMPQGMSFTTTASRYVFYHYCVKVCLLPLLRQGMYFHTTASRYVFYYYCVKVCLLLLLYYCVSHCTVVNE